MFAISGCNYCGYDSSGRCVRCGGETVSFVSTRGGGAGNAAGDVGGAMAFAIPPHWLRR